MAIDLNKEITFGPFGKKKDKKKGQGVAENSAAGASQPSSSDSGYTSDLGYTDDLSAGEANVQPEVPKGGRKKRRKGGKAWPSKTTINLYKPENKGIDLRKWWPLLAAAAIALVLFGKFGVYDRYAAISRAQSQLNSIRTETTQLESQIAAENYDEVESVYDAYNVKSQNLSVDAITVLSMVEGTAGTTNIISQQLSNNTLKIEVYGLSLETSGQLADNLRAQNGVKSVEVATATKAISKKSDATYESTTYTVKFKDSSKSSSSQ